MKIVAINSGCQGSSFNIATSILRFAKSRGDDVFFLTPFLKKDLDIPSFTFGKRIPHLFNRIITRIDGSDGFRNVIETKKLLCILDSICPDIVHLHTIHGYSIGLTLLVNYLKQKNIKTIISLHDCWWITGRCTHFFMNNCYKWKNECGCRYKSTYPKSLVFDKTRRYLQLKADLFKDMNDLTIVGVSNWISEQAYLSKVFKDKSIKVITNPIDTTFFSSPCMSNDFSYLKDGRFIILAVAVPWSDEKGLDYLEFLSKNLDFAKFKVVVVGSAGKIKSSKNFTIISSYLSRNQMKEIYSLADVFINPSKQETFSSTNIEAQLCGRRVVAFDAGGNKETLGPDSVLIKPYDFGAFTLAIKTICKSKKMNSERNRRFCLQFNDSLSYEKYYDLYKG